MADFCKECSIRIFSEDFADLAGLCGRGEEAEVLCEGCGGLICVDYTGTRVWPENTVPLDKESNTTTMASIADTPGE